jgi:hypothetical protein
MPDQPTYRSQVLDHLGLGAGMFNELDLGDVIEQATQKTDRQLVFQMLNGGLITQLIAVVTRLGIADVLADGAHSSAELAREVGAHPQALYRVLRALASLGIFAETPEGRFALPALARPLQTGMPDSITHGVEARPSTFLWYRK